MRRFILRVTVSTVLGTAISPLVGLMIGVLYAVIAALVLGTVSQLGFLVLAVGFWLAIIGPAIGVLTGIATSVSRDPKISVAISTGLSLLGGSVAGWFTNRQPILLTIPAALAGLLTAVLMFWIFGPGVPLLRTQEQRVPPSHRMP